MAAQYVGVIHGNVDRRIHRIVLPDSDSQLDLKITAANETLVKVVRSTYNSYPNHQALATALGLLG